MLSVRLFPQVLSDLNFFNVKSKEEFASRLRAVQRVAAAAIEAYLITRYMPILISKLGGTLISRLAAASFITVSYWCLSAPSFCLVIGGIGGYKAVLAIGLISSSLPSGRSIFPGESAEFDVKEDDLNPMAAVLTAFREYGNKRFILLAMCVGWFFLSYVICQRYKKCGNVSSNLLEKLFQKVEERYAEPLYHRFYSQIA